MMTNWLIRGLQKEARRFRPGNAVRYYVSPLKGKGKGIVLQPSFSRGTVTDYDPNERRYVIVDTKSGEEVRVHPRNIVPDVTTPAPIATPSTETNPISINDTQELNDFEVMDNHEDIL